MKTTIPGCAEPPRRVDVHAVDRGRGEKPHPKTSPEVESCELGTSNSPGRSLGLATNCHPEKPMLELLTDPNVWIAFATLTVMEIVLGIDNIVFISVLVSRLPKEQAERARKLGILLALVFRILLLLVISWVISLTQPAITLFGLALSWKDIILIAGGAFLIYKATHEM